MPRPSKDPVPFAVENFDKLPASARVSIRVGVVVTGLSRPTLYRRIKAGELELSHNGGISQLNVGELRRFMQAGA